MSASLEDFVLPGLTDIAPYNAKHHDFAWSRRDLARLMSNECPLPPSDAVQQAVAEAVAVGHLYPYSGADLRAALAHFAGVDESSVVLGNGSTELLDVVIRILVAPGDETIIATPTYAFFETQTRLCRGKPILVPLTDSWDLDVDEMLRSITPRTKAILLCSPNNPTGKGFTVESIETLLATGIPVIIDQAYLECGYAQSFAALTKTNRNLVVCRTMSKGFGLAALRVGWVIADPWLIGVIERVRIPFSVSLMGVWGCLAALNEPAELELRRTYIHDGAERLCEGMNAIPGVKAYPSDGNFVLADISGANADVARVVDILLQEDMLIRQMTAHRLQGSHIRVTVGTSDQNERFLDLLPGALESAKIVGASA